VTGAVTQADHYSGAPPLSLVERLGLPVDARVVIINADDLGMCHASTEGCVTALSDGVATSASLMAPCPWAAYAASRCDGADVGVHLTLNAEWERYRWGPLTSGPSLRLADGGFPRSVRHVIDNADVDEVRTELRAQIERLLAWGVDVTHLDAHMYVVQEDPRLVTVYLDLAVEFALPLRLSGSVGLSGDPIRGRAAELGVLAPDHLVPLPAMGSRQPLLRALASLESGVTELHAHPAIDTPELRALAPDWATRVDDLDLLRPDGDLATALRDSGAVLVGYRALRDAMRAG
jgi:chitin disaccharide deacetylase